MHPELPAHDAPEWLRFAVEETLPGSGFTTWIPGGEFAASSLTRVPRYPESIGDVDSRSLSLDVARNERRSAQLAAASTDPIEGLRADVSGFEGPDGAELPTDAIEVRYVGYVPVEESHISFDGHCVVDEVAGRGVSGDRAPDVVGDLLLERDAIDVPDRRAQGIWFTFDVPPDASPGSYEGEIEVGAEGEEPVTYAVDLTVRDVVLPDTEDASYHFDVWMHPDAVAAEHGVEPWSDRHWDLLDAYFDDLAGAGQRTITAAVVHEPWQREWLDGEWRSQTETGFSSLVEWRYDGEWSFDFARFDRYVEAALDRGVGPSISAFSVLTFRGHQRLSYYDADGEFVVESLEVDDERWREAWTAFLEAFADHLDERGWREQTYLAFDERPEELMEAATSVVEDAVPDFVDRIRVAGSTSVSSMAADLSVHYNNMPVDEDLVARRREAGRTTTFYGAIPITHPRTMAYSPAVESRMLPWIAAANDLDGVLRWSYNSWPRDVYDNPVFRYPQGGEYFVYPGEDGPLSSIRWELLREGLGEFELARLAGEVGRTGDDRENDADEVADAVDLAAREHDGREKDLGDVPTARRRLFDVLE